MKTELEIKNYIRELTESQKELEKVIFYNRDNLESVENEIEQSSILTTIIESLEWVLNES